MTELVITVPAPPIASNRRHGSSRHWRALEREKRAYWEQLRLLQLCRQLPPPPATPIAKATLRSMMYLGAAMDEDNAVIRHKWPLDWLVRAGYLACDRRKCLRWEGFPEQIIKRDDRYRLVLTFTYQEASDV
jgi:hypothetical protein